MLSYRPAVALIALETSVRCGSRGQCCVKPYLSIDIWQPMTIATSYGFFRHRGVSELCPFEISWDDVLGGVVEESIFGCVGDAFLLVDDHSKWPLSHHGGLFFYDGANSNLAVVVI